MNTFDFSYPKYLSAKEAVDENALNDRVLQRFLDELCRRTDSRPQVLEVGGGTGAMLRRLIPRLEDTSKQGLEYTLVDERQVNIEAAHSDLCSWAKQNGYDVHKKGAQQYILENGGLDSIQVDFQVDDFFEYAGRREERFDAIIAHAVLDLVDLDRAFHHMGPRLRNRGLWYLPMHFDGLTAFEPSIKPSLDRTIVRLYHESMSEPRTGRRMLTALRNANSNLLEVGASDWIIYSQEGNYPEKERYFLMCILNFVYDEITQYSDVSDDVLEAWIQRRTKQLDAGELIYMAHQIDTCAEYKRV